MPRKNFTIQELNELSDRDYISALWGDNVLNAIDRQTTTPMSNDEFLSHCTACGGNWGAMLLTGIKALWPEVYDAIPEDMGILAWNCISATIGLLGVSMVS